MTTTKHTKTIGPTSKLTLRRESLRALTTNDLKQVVGGGSRTIGCNK